MPNFYSPLLLICSGDDYEDGYDEPYDDHYDYDDHDDPHDDHDTKLDLESIIAKLLLTVTPNLLW